eukprot:768456-Hanusia_phi.AAC.1
MSLLVASLLLWMAGEAAGHGGRHGHGEGGGGGGGGGGVGAGHSANFLGGHDDGEQKPFTSSEILQLGRNQSVCHATPVALGHHCHLPHQLEQVFSAPPSAGFSLLMRPPSLDSLVIMPLMPLVENVSPLALDLLQAIDQPPALAALDRQGDPQNPGATSRPPLSLVCRAAC